MGKNDDEMIRRMMTGGAGQPQIAVAAPQGWDHLVAWVAAMVYPHVVYLAEPGEQMQKNAKAAVDAALEIVAQSSVAVRSGALRERAAVLGKETAPADGTEN